MHWKRAQSESESERASNLHKLFGNNSSYILWFLKHEYFTYGIKQRVKNNWPFNCFEMEKKLSSSANKDVFEISSSDVILYTFSLCLRIRLWIKKRGYS